MRRVAIILAFVTAVGGCGPVVVAPDGTPYPLPEAARRQVYGFIREVKRSSVECEVTFEIVNKRHLDVFMHRTVRPARASFEEGAWGKTIVPADLVSPTARDWIRIIPGQTHRGQLLIEAYAYDKQLINVEIDILAVVMPPGRVVPPQKEWPVRYWTITMVNPEWAK
jgi:hypothetical protein